MLGGVHYLPNGGKYIKLIWGADLYAILIQTWQEFVTPHPPLSCEFMCTHVCLGANLNTPTFLS